MKYKKYFSLEDASRALDQIGCLNAVSEQMENLILDASTAVQHLARLPIEDAARELLIQAEGLRHFRRHFRKELLHQEITILGKAIATLEYEVAELERCHQDKAPADEFDM